MSDHKFDKEVQRLLASGSDRQKLAKALDVGGQLEVGDSCVE